MPNYNTALQSNNIDLQSILNTINTLPNASGEQATPVISINDDGLITATAGTKSVTKQLAFQAATTIMPSTTSQIAVSSGYYTGGDITVAAIPDTYIIPNGTKTITTNGTHDVRTYLTVSVNVAGSSGGGNTDTEDSLVTKNITNYVNNRVKQVGTHAFAYAYHLQSVEFQNASVINTSAFYRCSSLTAISFPAVISINANAFYNCKKLTAISFPVAVSIGSSAFGNCSSLTEINFPKATIIHPSAFYWCSSLTETSFPNVKYISANAFYNCRSLAVLSFPQASNISASAFYGCFDLMSLYLANSRICTLSNSNAFTSTPIGGYGILESGYGSIYVPASLLTSYKTATNWTYFSSRFVAIPNFITFTIDGTSYQAEEGMTWGEWCDSEYNLIGCSAVFHIAMPDGRSLYNEDLLLVSDDIIIADGSYYFE